jgi:hypothetical protein
VPQNRCRGEHRAKRADRYNSAQRINLRGAKRKQCGMHLIRPFLLDPMPGVAQNRFNK